MSSIPSTDATQGGIVSAEHGSGDSRLACTPKTKGKTTTEPRIRCSAAHPSRAVKRGSRPVSPTGDTTARGDAASVQGLDNRIRRTGIRSSSSSSRPLYLALTKSASNRVRPAVDAPTPSHSSRRTSFPTQDRTTPSTNAHRAHKPRSPTDALAKIQRPSIMTPDVAPRMEDTPVNARYGRDSHSPAPSTCVVRSSAGPATPLSPAAPEPTQRIGSKISTARLFPTPSSSRPPAKTIDTQIHDPTGLTLRGRKSQGIKTADMVSSLQCRRLTERSRTLDPATTPPCDDVGTSGVLVQMHDSTINAKNIGCDNVINSFNSVTAENIPMRIREKLSSYLADKARMELYHEKCYPGTR